MKRQIKKRRFFFLENSPLSKLIYLKKYETNGIVKIFSQRAERVFNISSIDSFFNPNKFLRTIDIQVRGIVEGSGSFEEDKLNIKGDVDTVMNGINSSYIKLKGIENLNL